VQEPHCVKARTAGDLCGHLVGIAAVPFLFSVNGHSELLLNAEPDVGGGYL
jgi:hypothetical protein